MAGSSNSESDQLAVIRQDCLSWRQICCFESPRCQLIPTELRTSKTMIIGLAVIVGAWFRTSCVLVNDANNQAASRRMLRSARRTTCSDLGIQPMLRLGRLRQL